MIKRADWFTETAVIIMMVFLAPGVQAQESDSVTDTDLHILAGAIISLATSAAFLFGTPSDEMTLVRTVAIAGGSTLGAGIGKELFDSIGFGTPELRDILNTAVGGLLGVSVVAFSLGVFPSGPGSSLSSDELRYTYLAVSGALSLTLLHHIYGNKVDRPRPYNDEG